MDQQQFDVTLYVTSFVFAFSAISNLRKREEDLGSTGSARRARQDLLRRRDLNLYHGLHPRVLDQQQQPPLSLPLRRTSTPLNMSDLKPTTGPFRAYPRDEVSFHGFEPTAQDSEEPQKSEEEDCSFVSTFIIRPHLTRFYVATYMYS